MRKQDWNCWWKLIVFLSAAAPSSIALIVCSTQANRVLAVLLVESPKEQHGVASKEHHGVASKEQHGVASKEKHGVASKEQQATEEQ